MKSSPLLTTALYTGILLLAVAPSVLAHGDDEAMNMDMAMANDHGASIANTTEEVKVYPPTYFAHPEHRSLIYAHIILMTLAWVFALPVAVMLSIARSRYTLPVQLVFLASNGAGVLFSAVYNGKTPDLYPNNAHHKVGWIATWVVCAQVIVSLLARVAGAFKSRYSDSENMSSSERRAFIPVSSQALAEHSSHHHAHHSSSFRLSNDSGQGTEPNTESLRSNSVSTLGDNESIRHKESYETDEPEGHGNGDDFYDEDLEDARVPSSLGGRGGRFTALAAKAASMISSRAWRFLMLAYNVVDRSILLLGFVTFALGIVTYGRFFEGHGIFSGLAHWVKGSVFFWLGIVTLGRWAGCFGEWGWAWNVRPKSASQNKWRPSAEFVESFLIFFYGSTNVFLEHLGNAGKPYSAQDLEHVSITILFIGGGLCGMLIESTTVRDLLNTNVTEAAHEYPESNYLDEEREALRPPPQYQFSVNPIPALVILLLGVMMSSHTQHSMISSMIHKQWGNLLTGASFARGLTYVLTYLRPPTSILPSRPPTELLASFGLIAGGIIFMASSSDTVDGMIHYELDAMFMYTVTMGLVGVLMSWVIFVIALKGWAVRKEAGRPTGSYQLS
ncbi:integral membrane protein [Ophiostoma piceae UAMH 11346]|uniref:Integral membrane protein n=1 Tax=Ophiostoma piceae (strain UAMH 11346) TaxID=1262450 RepID=S3CRV8_OPHP1|nr:integral membrane protein [Ophiostoma piceae UAMH 11346]